MTSPPTSSAQAEQIADEKRAALASSIEQLQEHLQPSNLAKEAASAVKRRTPEPVVSTWAFLCSPIGVALVASIVASIESTRWAKQRRLRRRSYGGRR